MSETSRTPEWLDLDDIEDEELLEAPDPTDDGTDEPAASPAPDAADDAAPEATPDEPEAPSEAPPQDPQDAGAPAEAPAAPPPPPEPTPVPEPLTLKASRKTVTIDGVLRTKDGLLITADAERRITDLLRRGADAEQVLVPENVQLRKRVVELESAKSAREVEFDAMVQQIDTILDGGPDAVVQFLEDYYRQRPILKAKAIEAAANWKMEQAQRATQPDPEEYHAAIEQEAREVIADTVRQQVQAAGLDAADADALVQRYGNRLAAFVVQVPHDMPEHGLRAGQYAVNRNTLLEELQYDVSLRADARAAKQKADALAKAQEQAKAAAAVKQTNAAVLKQAAKTTKPNPKAASAAPKGSSHWLADVLADDDDD